MAQEQNTNTGFKGLLGWKNSITGEIYIGRDIFTFADAKVMLDMGNRLFPYRHHWFIPVMGV